MIPETSKVQPRIKGEKMIMFKLLMNPSHVAMLQNIPIIIAMFDVDVKQVGNVFKTGFKYIISDVS